MDHTSVFTQPIISSCLHTNICMRTDNEAHYPNFIAPCPRIHKHLDFSFTVSALLKIFVRSRRDQEKKCRIGIRHNVKKHCALYLNFSKGLR